MNNKTIFDTICGILGGVAGFLFGAIDGLFYALVAFAVLDYITGVISAVIQKKLSSRVGFEGIFKKIMVFVVIAVANIIDVHVFAASGVLRTAAIFFFISNEGLSILENAGRMGLPIPKKLLDVLEQLRAKNNDNGGNHHE
ncbi:MAG: phage holin family protein [Oscillospiraceae bacterium]|nr:phage holin family protein [Oscillospiraceae bacterium]